MLNDMHQKYEIIVSSLDTPDPLKAGEVVVWLVEAADLLLVAAAQHDSVDQTVADGFRVLARECRRAATPFVQEPADASMPGHPARDTARTVLQDVVEALRLLAPTC